MRIGDEVNCCICGAVTIQKAGWGQEEFPMCDNCDNRACEVIDEVVRELEEKKAYDAACDRAADQMDSPMFRD